MYTSVYSFLLIKTIGSRFSSILILLELDGDKRSERTFDAHFFDILSLYLQICIYKTTLEEKFDLNNE